MRPDKLDRPDELENVPGCIVERDSTPAALAIPTERLDETAEWKAGDFRDEVLVVAANLFQGRFAYGPVNVSDKELDEGINLADRLIRRVDKFCKRPTPPISPKPIQPAAVSRDSFPAVESQLAYLKWLAGRDGSCPKDEHPSGMVPRQADDVRQHLRGRGLITETSLGWAMTANGWNSIEPVEVPPERERGAA